MHKIVKAGALALALAAVLAAVTFFTVQTAPRAERAAYAVQVAQTALRQGSRGETVRTVQTKLKRWGYYSGSVDGIYGPATEKAVRAFQKKNGLAVDGVVGRATFAALGMPASSGGGNSNNGGSGNNGSGGYTDADTYLLARCIYGEARRSARHRAGRRRGGRAQPGAQPRVSQHRRGRHLPAARLHRRQRRANKPHPGRDGHLRRARRDERLGSDGRLPLLLQPPSPRRASGSSRARRSSPSAGTCLPFKEGL